MSGDKNWREKIKDMYILHFLEFPLICMKIQKIPPFVLCTNFLGMSLSQIHTLNQYNDPVHKDVSKAVEGLSRHNLMKWHITSCPFTKLDDFLPLVIYMVAWSLHNKQLRFLLIHTSWKTEIRFFSITETCRFLFEAAVFNQERLLYCT